MITNRPIVMKKDELRCFVIYANEYDLEKGILDRHITVYIMVAKTGTHALLDEVSDAVSDYLKQKTIQEWLDWWEDDRPHYNYELTQIKASLKKITGDVKMDVAITRQEDIFKRKYYEHKNNPGVFVYYTTDS